MDARITKQRLSNMISYDWIKIIVIIVAAIFALTTLMSMIGTKPEFQQTMYFIYYRDVNKGDEISYAENLLSAENSNSAFSYEIMETTSLYMCENERYADMALSMRMAAGQYSIGISSEREDPDTEDEKGNKKSYVHELIASGFTLLEDVNDYLSDAEKYLNAYYGGDYSEGTLDEEYLEETFRSRAKGDKRYRTEKSIAEGLKDERARIERTAASLSAVKKAIAEGVFVVAEEEEFSSEYNSAKGSFYLKVGTERMSSMKKYVCLYSEDANGEQISTCEGISLVFYKLPGENQQYMRFEKLNYLGFLIDTYMDKI